MQNVTPEVISEAPKEGCESLARKGNLKPVREYLTEQGRFRNITEEQTSQLQEWVNIRWKRYIERATNPQHSSITEPAS